MNILPTTQDQEFVTHGSGEQPSFKRFYSQRTLRDFLRLTKISLKNRYVYFSIGKVANSTLNHCLQSVEYEGTPLKVDNLFKWQMSPMLSPFQLSVHQWEEIIRSEDFRKFAFVRNPYSRLLSCYLDRMQDPASMPYRNAEAWLKRSVDDLKFAEFVSMVEEQSPSEMDCHWRPQVYEICENELKLDRIFYFEDLPDALGEVSAYLFGESKMAFKRDTNKSPAVTNAVEQLHCYYDDSLFKKVYSIYQRDFASFDFPEDPAQQRPTRPPT